MFELKELCAYVARCGYRVVLAIMVDTIPMWVERNKGEYTFFIIEDSGKYRLLWGVVYFKEVLRLLRKTNPDSVRSYEELKAWLQTKAGFAAYLEHFYMIEDNLSDAILHDIEQVKDMDLSKPPQGSQGLDGFTTYVYNPSNETEMSVWCVHHDAYYAPLTGLANLLLDTLGLDDDFRIDYCAR